MAPQPTSSDELTGPTLGRRLSPCRRLKMMSIGNCDPQPDAASNNNTTTMAIGMMMKMATAASCTGPNIPNVGPFQEDRFEQLVLRLKDALGPSSGLTSDDVDVEFLTRLMEDYDGSDNQWPKYAFGDHSRGYTRNLVDEGNGKSNLLVLVWTPGKGSPIHDHGNAHCLMKILKGNLTETRYAFPEENEQERPMRVISEKTYKKNAVAYMADELGLHRVSNKGSDFAVSLHRGQPPSSVNDTSRSN
ncbi:cysteine dioxygenase [Fusarium albosuccineum]|uniref:Cysteine dioxygenase n=1 Tax=Fusarium albosuccineum TaxID=1237068 RepID=A0A8H4PM55_9HYPO|nr:cysteine dioxygenase [Fusarium albosuccineum]